MSRVERRKQEKKAIMKREISLAIICIMLITLILSVTKTLPAAPEVYVIGENVQAALGTESGVGRAKYCEITLIDPSKPRLY